MNTHPLLLKATGVIAALALVASLFGFGLSAAVQPAQAATMAEQIICYVDEQLGPNMPFALLGNNFLSRFNMQRNNDMMVLEKTR